MFVYYNHRKKNLNLVYNALYTLPHNQGTLQDILAVDAKFKTQKVQASLNDLVRHQLVFTNAAVYKIA